MEIIENKSQLSDIERIQIMADMRGLSLNAFARSLGYKTAQIFYDIKKGKHRISRELANKIHEKYLEYDLAWILTGTHEKDITSHNKPEVNETNSYTVKELMAAIKRRDEHVEALIRVNEKHADNLAELLKQMKKTDALKGGDVGCVDASGFSDK